MRSIIEHITAQWTDVCVLLSMSLLCRCVVIMRSLLQFPLIFFLFEPDHTGLIDESIINHSAAECSLFLLYSCFSLFYATQSSRTTSKEKHRLDLNSV